MNDAAPWLERELARRLAPVAAPESLWYRIQEPRVPVRRGNSFRWTVWPAVALVTLIVCAGAFLELNRRVPRDLAELARSSGEFDFRSNDFGAIRSWVKTKANIDIDLPDGTAARSAAARVLGARLLRLRGLPIAAVDYQVGEGAATLLVSAKRADIGAKAPGMKSDGSTRLVSWNIRNQNYAIAFSGAGDIQSACLLCHANLPGPIAVN